MVLDADLYQAALGFWLWLLGPLAVLHAGFEGFWL
jgi:hypothetical protein